MSLFRWEKGRQKSGYSKFTIIKSKLLKLDMYLLKYPTDSEISKHIDSVDLKYEHHRINIILRKAILGGQFICNGDMQKSRFHYFRPDIMEHSVTKIEKGNRFVFSIGWLKKKKT